ncbi:hypothetical protein V2J09_024220 [Rumex salicifolius]
MDSVRALGIVCVLLLVQNVTATQFIVGGSTGWSLPSDNNAVYNQWAEKMRFQNVFVYHGDSVLRVTKDDYTNCNTASPLEKHTDGHTVFTFSKSGPYYFISGNQDNCKKNEKLAVVVLADRTKKAPSPSPSSSPPAPPTDGNPASPTPETPSTPNDAASFAMGIVGSVGALAAVIMAF